MPNDEMLEPSFYFGGTVYVFTEEVAKGGSELAEAAFFETYRYIWKLFADWCAGRISDEERLRQKAELMMGAFMLRDLIDKQDALVSSSSLVIVH